MSRTDFDVGIIGGGPGGSSAASYLAKAGVKCVLLEREVMPRQHVGESLVPATTRVLTEIGFVDEMDRSGFVRKYGAVWTAATSGIHKVDFEGSGDTPRDVKIRQFRKADGVQSDFQTPIQFAEREQPGVDRDYTWHVDRGKFDQLLLQHAKKLGANVYEGCQAQEVDFSEREFPKITFKPGKRSLRVKCVIDASGRYTLLGNQLGLKVNDPLFNQYALHTWFEHYDRRRFANRRSMGEAVEDYIFIHFLPVSNTWVWQIPITNSVTSIGVVTQKQHFAKSRGSREEFFWSTLASRPDLYNALKQAAQLRPLKEEGDYSYAMKQICGDGFVMIGDAARFVDPIFSSGVSIAMNSARLATRSIISTLQKGRVCNHKSFEEFQKTMRRGTKNWYEFISLYYRLNILFTAFVQDPRYRLDILKLLQGDVYDVDPPVLKDMRRVVTAVENNPNHPWHKLLGSLTNEALRSAF